MENRSRLCPSGPSIATRTSLRQKVVRAHDARQPAVRQAQHRCLAARVRLLRDEHVRLPTVVKFNNFLKAGGNVLGQVQHACHLQRRQGLFIPGRRALKPKLRFRVLTVEVPAYEDSLGLHRLALGTKLQGKAGLVRQDDGMPLSCMARRHSRGAFNRKGCEEVEFPLEGIARVPLHCLQVASDDRIGVGQAAPSDAVVGKGHATGHHDVRRVAHVRFRSHCTGASRLNRRRRFGHLGGNWLRYRLLVASARDKRRQSQHNHKRQKNPLTHIYLLTAPTALFVGPLGCASARAPFGNSRAPCAFASSL